MVGVLVLSSISVSMCVFTPSCRSACVPNTQLWSSCFFLTPRSGHHVCAQFSTQVSTRVSTNHPVQVTQVCPSLHLGNKMWPTLRYGQRLVCPTRSFGQHVCVQHSVLVTRMCPTLRVSQHLVCPPNHFGKHVSVQHSFLVIMRIHVSVRRVCRGHTWDRLSLNTPSTLISHD